MPVVIAFLIAVIGFVSWDYFRVSQIYIAPQDRMAAYRENTLAKVRDTAIFQSQVEFATLATVELDADNAAEVNHLAMSLLHFSPEPRVIESVIESAELLGQIDEATFYRTRYQAAFPEQFAMWAHKQ